MECAFIQLILTRMKILTSCVVIDLLPTVTVYIVGLGTSIAVKVMAGLSSSVMDGVTDFISLMILSSSAICSGLAELIAW